MTEDRARRTVQLQTVKALNVKHSIKLFFTLGPRLLERTLSSCSGFALTLDGSNENELTMLNSQITAPAEDFFFILISPFYYYRWYHSA